MHKAMVVFTGYGDCSRELSFQHGVLLLLIGVSIPVGATFSLINYAYGHVWLAVILALVSLVLTVFIVMGLAGKWPTRSREILMLYAFGVIEFTYDHHTLRYAPAMYLFFTMVACSFQLQQEKR